MASSASDDKIGYVMTVLKNTSLTKPDYANVAVEAGITSANTAQKRFRAIVKAAGYDLVNDQIVGADGSTGASKTQAATPAKKPRARKATSETPKKKAATKKSADDSPSKKRKLSEATTQSDDEEDVPEVPVKAESEKEGDDDDAGEGEGGNDKE